MKKRELLVGNFGKQLIRLLIIPKTIKYNVSINQNTRVGVRDYLLINGDPFRSAGEMRGYETVVNTDAMKQDRINIIAFFRGIVFYKKFKNIFLLNTTKQSSNGEHLNYLLDPILN